MSIKLLDANFEKIPFVDFEIRQLLLNFQYGIHYDNWEVADAHIVEPKPDKHTFYGLYNAIIIPGEVAEIFRNCI